jgi:hypothetical protein
VTLPTRASNSCTACFSSRDYCYMAVRREWAEAAEAETLDQIRTKPTCSSMGHNRSHL